MTTTIDKMRAFAGLAPKPTVIVERWESDDDFDEDPDVKIANADARQRAFERKAKPVLSAANKEIAAAKQVKAEKPVPAKAPTAPEKKEDPKVNPPEDKAAEEKKEEAKRKGKAPNENSKFQRANAWIKGNPGGRRGEFIKWASENLGMGTAYASAAFARLNPRSGRSTSTPSGVNECYIITHPSSSSYILSEQQGLVGMQWIDPKESNLNIALFNTKAEAEKVQLYMAEWKGQVANIEHIVLED